MLEAKNLSLRYGKHLALDCVSMSVNEGECVAILGANGAGKSSLLRGLTSMLPTEPGTEITFRGASLLGRPAHEIVELGIAHVPEGRGLFSELSVEDNLLLGANPRRARSGERQRLARSLALFPRLEERRRQIVDTMSGGEQQMVAIARAMMSNPDILLLDEPSLGLAPIVVGELFRALRGICATGVSILLVEQNVKISLAMASRGYLLEAGRIVGSNSAANLMTDPAVRQAFLGH